MCISWKVAQLPQSERGATHHLQHNISWIHVMEVYHETELLFGLGWVGPFQAILPNGAFFQARNSGASLTEKVKPLVKFNIPTYPLTTSWTWKKNLCYFMVFIHKTREFPLQIFLRIRRMGIRMRREPSSYCQAIRLDIEFRAALSFSPAMKVPNEIAPVICTSSWKLNERVNRWTLCTHQT